MERFTKEMLQKDLQGGGGGASTLRRLQYLQQGTGHIIRNSLEIKLVEDEVEGWDGLLTASSTVATRN